MIKPLGHNFKQTFLQLRSLTLSPPSSATPHTHIFIQTQTVFNDVHKAYALLGIKVSTYEET